MMSQYISNFDDYIHEYIEPIPTFVCLVTGCVLSPAISGSMWLEGRIKEIRRHHVIWACTYFFSQLFVSFISVLLKLVL